MDKKKNSLRAAAVKQLHQASTTNSATRSAEELLYELQVHQIELEMQNENLRQSYEALAESQQDYVDLYGFAPIGYLTLSQQGLIEKINLTGARLLGKSRSQLLQRRFAGFINTTDADRWHLFFTQVMRGNEQKTLEVSLKQPNGNGLYVQLHCRPILKADKQPTLWIALTDITESKQVASELVIAANIELAFQNEEKENRAAELVIANIELAFQNEEKENRAAELGIANIELAFQNEEKENRAAELVIANIELTFQNEEKEKRRKIENALQKSELKLNFLLSNAPVTIFTCEVTPPFRLTYISPNITAILGYLPEQFLENCNFWERNIHPDDVAQIYKHLSQLFKNDTYQHEYRFRTTDGSYRWIYNEVRLTRDEAGEPNQIIGFWVDITERKKIEKQLTKSERHLRAILETSPECVKLVARDGTLLSMNSSGLAIIDADSEDKVFNQCVYSLLAPEYRDAFQAFNEAVCDGKSGKMEFEIIGLKGTRHWMESHAVPFSLENGNGDIVQLAFSQEITERKRLEKSLRDSESKFRAIYDSTSDAIMLGIPNFFDCNQAALTLFGCKTVAELCTYHSADLSPLEQPCGTNSLILAEQKIATALKIGQLRFEWTHKRIDTGGIFVAEVLLTALILNEKPVLQATIHDISKRKAAEEKIKQLAFYDPLTGLPNRRKLLDRLHYSLSINHRANSQFAVFMMDLDKFKAVNDSLGHAAGDELLKQVAARIINCLRDSDMVARLGGDEFVLVLENLKIPEAAEIIALKVIAELTVPFQLSDNDTVQIGASIGISLYPQNGNTPESLMDHADSALYQAKDNGRGCFAYFSGNE